MMMQSGFVGLFPKKKTGLVYEADFRPPSSTECAKLSYSSLFPKEKTNLKISDLSISTDLGKYTFESLANLLKAIDQSKSGEGKDFTAKRDSLFQSIKKLIYVYHEYKLTDEDKDAVIKQLLDFEKKLLALEASHKPGPANLSKEGPTLVLTDAGLIEITGKLQFFAGKVEAARDYKQAAFLYQDALNFAIQGRRLCQDYHLQQYFLDNRLQELDANVKKCRAAEQNNLKDAVLQANQFRKAQYDFINQMDKVSLTKLPPFMEEESYCSSLMFLKEPFVDNTFSYQNIFQLNLPPKTVWKRLIPKYVDVFDLSILRPSKIVRKHAENSPLIAALVSILVYDKHLLSNNVYPQYFDGSSIQILHNPDGLYLLKVYVNGTYRKIYLDNYFPVMGSNETYGHLSETDLLLPLWTKAFWKLYEYGVAVNNFDPTHYIWTMLGPRFIPETIKLSKLAAKKAWTQIKNCVIDRQGIVSAKSNAQGKDDKEIYYPILRVIETPNLQALVLQNPSKYSDMEIGACLSVERYPHLEKEIKQIYEEFSSVISEENGIFLIGYETFVENFDYVFINWDSTRYYKHKYSLQRIDELANSANLPVHYLYENAQFQVIFKEPMNKQTQVAVVIEDHTTKLPAASQLCFDLYSQSKEFAIHETKVENQGYIVRNTSKLIGSTVVSTQLRSNDFSTQNELSFLLTTSLKDPSFSENKKRCAYTLHFYSTEQLEVLQLDPNLKFKRTEGEVTTPGSISHFEKGFIHNPQLCLTPSTEISNSTFWFQAEIKNNNGACLGLKLVNMSQYNADQRAYVLDPATNDLATSIVETPNYSFLTFSMPVGSMTRKYNLIVVPMDENIKKPSPYEIQVYSNIKFDLKPIPTEDEEFSKLQIGGKWAPANAGGSQNLEDYRKNPKYVFQTDCSSKFKIRIDDKSSNGYLVNAAIYKCPFQLSGEGPNFKLFSPTNPVLTTHYVSMGGTMKLMFSKDAFHQISETRTLEAGTYVIIPSTFEPNCQGEFGLTLYLNKGTKIICKGFDV